MRLSRKFSFPSRSHSSSGLDDDVRIHGSFDFFVSRENKVTKLLEKIAKLWNWVLSFGGKVRMTNALMHVLLGFDLDEKRRHTTTLFSNDCATIECGIVKVMTRKWSPFFLGFVVVLVSVYSIQSTFGWLDRSKKRFSLYRLWSRLLLLSFGCVV